MYVLFLLPTTLPLIPLQQMKAGMMWHPMIQSSRLFSVRSDG